MKLQISLSFALLCIAAVYAQPEEPNLIAVCQERCTDISCYLSHPKSCRKWLLCVMPINQAFEMECSRGTFFDESIKTCVHSRYVACEYDQCKVPDTLSYKDDYDNHCRYHWTCREDGRSHPTCCQAGYAYVAGQGCVEDPTCFDHCHSDYMCERSEPGPNCITYWNCTDSKHFESVCCPPGHGYNSTLQECVEDPLCTDACPKAIGCPAQPVQGNNKQFIHGGETKMCPKGTLFDVSVCQCVMDDQYKRACDPTVDVDFMGEKNIASLAYVDYFPESLANGSGIGYFDGMSHLEVPYFFHGKDLEKFSIHLEFKTGGTNGPSRQVLASNCKTEGTEQASLQVLLDRENEVLMVFANTYTEPKLFEIKYEQNQWNEFELKFDGSELKAKVVPETPDSLKTYKGEVKLIGKLRKASMPLNFGACLGIVDQANQPVNTHFIGEMRNILVYTDCLPKPEAPLAVA